MAKRSYGQHCGLAVGLDVLAERWTLLVIRELMPGGRRFNDLFDSLPGVSTDLLTARLRSLEEAGVIERRTIRHPAKITLYELSDWGEGLRPIIGELALWGTRLLPEPGHPDYRMSYRSALLSISIAYRGSLADGDYQFTIDDEDLTIAIQNGVGRLHYGPATGEVQLHLAGTADDFYQLAGSRGTDLGQSRLLLGTPDAVSQLLSWIPIAEAH